MFFSDGRRKRRKNIVEDYKELKPLPKKPKVKAILAILGDWRVDDNISNEKSKSNESTYRDDQPIESESTPKIKIEQFFWLLSVAILLIWGLLQYFF